MVKQGLFGEIVHCTGAYAHYLNKCELFCRNALHAEYEMLGPRGGHGGMDWLVCRAFVEAVKNETNTPIDAYDSVTWLTIGVL